MTRLSFFHLPRELRDDIYVHYVTIDGGYVFNQDSGKLRPATPHAHPFALQRTCTRAASEMTGLALSCNTVTFSTVGNVRESAFRFEFMLHRFLDEVRRDFDDAARDEHNRFTLFSIPDSLRESIADKFPQFVPVLDAVDSQVLLYQAARPSTSILPYIAVEPSLRSEFCDFVVHQLAEASHTCIQDPGVYRLGLRDQTRSMEEWHIPSKEELDYMAKVLRSTVASVEAAYGTPVIELDGIWERNRFIYRFSAAAAAIQFLRRHPASRLHLRRIILDEDREAVAFPPRHGKGLVPFCLENPRLHIERRVNLWTNLFPVATRTGKDRGWLDRLQAFSPSEAPNNVRRRLRDINWAEGMYAYTMWDENRGIRPDYLSERLSEWILEAAVLPDTISLVFDGNPAPEQATEIFEKVVVQEAIWQDALEQCLARGVLPDINPVHSKKWWDWMINLPEQRGRVCEGFPHMIRELIRSSGRIRCNFPLGACWEAEVEQVIWANREWTNEDWRRTSSTRCNRDVWFPTRPPLPDFSVILGDDELPPASGDSTSFSGRGRQIERQLATSV
ncbi:hypothetical protein CONLIGDRAFT_153930 [Coniochaeta ligniaria NRRL 30616]|uniref:Uncharacterized protein n=1 Tax=Coniochaeta ligniaria NRRL 30616 TaxID=1408157 RepID=A0A1J7JTY6_9PEZI|nr:hypothetical protein CONLIGDRAFT_153930 [Coniochaeta ligniaria NRRL 30616]